MNYCSGSYISSMNGSFWCRLKNIYAEWLMHLFFYPGRWMVCYSVPITDVSSFHLLSPVREARECTEWRDDYQTTVVISSVQVHNYFRWKMYSGRDSVLRFLPFKRFPPMPPTPSSTLNHSLTSLFPLWIELWISEELERRIRLRLEKLVVIIVSLRWIH